MQEETRGFIVQGILKPTLMAFVGFRKKNDSVIQDRQRFFQMQEVQDKTGLVATLFMGYPFTVQNLSF